MERLLETFCLLEGSLLHLSYHSARVKESIGEGLRIDQFVAAIQRDPTYPSAQKGKWRVSVEYDSDKILAIRVIPYQLPSISALQPIELQDNIYPCKWADRSFFGQVKEGLPLGVEPLFILQGRVTDTTFTNVVLERGGQLFTPTSYLVKGTQRSRLLEEGIIREREIRLNDLANYERIHLINAMLLPSQLTLPIP